VPFNPNKEMIDVVQYLISTVWDVLVCRCFCHWHTQRDGYKVQTIFASTWNTLPRSVHSSTSVLQFRSRLKIELFAYSYQQSYWICLCHHRCRLFILGTGAQLKRLYQSNVDYRSKNVFTPVKHYRGILCNTLL